MRYHYEPRSVNIQCFGYTYNCDHPVYNQCTLYLLWGIGLAVIQQKFNKETKSTTWEHVDYGLANDIYLNPGFVEYFKKNAGECVNGLYPTVSVRQIMWALKMKPLKKERWETMFDRKDI